MAFDPRHLLVPVDVDPAADRELAAELVEEAAAFAQRVGAHVTLLHVAVPVAVPSATPLAMGFPGAPLDMTGESYRALLDLDDSRAEAAGRMLAELAQRAHVAWPDVSISTRVTTRAGSVAHVIADVAREMDADLLMIATHGRRGFARLVLGSVAERVAHLAHVPVLLMPPTAHARHAQRGAEATP